MSCGPEPHHDTRRRRRLWILGAAIVAIALLLQAGAATVVVMLLPDQGDGWRTVARESATPAMQNAGLLTALLVTIAAVAFVVWLLAWGIRELVSGLRPHRSRSHADTDEAPS